MTALTLGDVVRGSEAVAATRSRTRKTELLAEILAQSTDQELPIVVAWLSGSLPQGRVGLGYAAVYGRPTPSGSGDLDVLAVHAAFDHLAGLGGKGAGTARIGAWDRLRAALDPPRAAFLGALIVGELRQGAVAGLMVEALALATGHPAPVVRRAAMLLGDLHEVAHLCRVGRAALDAVRLVPFRPVAPMLADTADSLELAGPVAVEDKLDGARVQIHRDGPRVRVWSRDLHEVTERVPELVNHALALPAERFVLDGETLVMRPDGQPEAFQTTMRRFGRKNEVDALRATLPLSAFSFDLLLLGDTPLWEAPGHQRAAALEDLVPPGARVRRTVTASRDEAEAAYEDALDRGHEGVMLKSLDAPYEAGHRGSAWLKHKAVHTVDLVVLGVEWGSGRRTGWLSNLHLGARSDTGFVMVGKTFKGLTDTALAWLTAWAQANESHRDGWTVYVAPRLVVEVRINGVQRSPVYPGGVALRFARVKAFHEGRSPADATRIESLILLAPP